MDINHDGFHLTVSIILKGSFQHTIIDCQLCEEAGDTKMDETGPCLFIQLFNILKEYH